MYGWSRRAAGLVLLVWALGLGGSGCNNKTLDPSQIGRFRATPAVNVILNSLGVAEETPVAWENAQEPQPGDIVAVKTDYALRPGDTVRISIFELFQEGVPVGNDYVVPETGRISVPDVGVIQAAGLTERQLEDEIKRILSPGVLRNPSVTVTLLDSQQRTFSILGNAVSRPSRYLIPRYDFRLADALATAGAQTQFNVSYIYVSRRSDAGPETVVMPKERQTPELDLLEPGKTSKTEDRGQTTLSPSVPRRPSSGIPNPTEPAQKYESQREMLDLITPRAQSPAPGSGRAAQGARAVGPDEVTASVMPEQYRMSSPRLAQPRSGMTQGEVQTLIEFGGGAQPPEPPVSSAPSKPRTEWIFRNGKWVQVTITGQGGQPAQASEAAPIPAAPQAQPAPKPVSAQPQPAPEGEWALRNGQWVRVPKGELQVAKPPAEPLVRPRGSETLPLDADWEQAIQTRLIRIPADKLLAGDPRYNIVIKPGDTIHVPVNLIGEFAIMGNVNRSGYIDITGRPMTLKMAIAAAGGLGPLAWPKNVEVVRRIGTAREEIVLVDLDKIASGEQPDFFIKPNDLINVGTHWTARWRAVLRNAFRATYGFGFVYDRNFADIDYGYTGFTHWF